MSLDLAELLDAAESHARQVVTLEAMTRHEPAAAPGGRGLTVGIWLGPITPVRTGGLTSTSVRVELQAVLYWPASVQPLSRGELAIAAAVDALCRAYSGDFTLGDTVMNVDLLGQHGVALGGRPGWTKIDGAEFRIFTITVPLIISDLWGQSA